MTQTPIQFISPDPAVAPAAVACEPSALDAPTPTPEIAPCAEAGIRPGRFAGALRAMAGHRRLWREAACVMADQMLHSVTTLVTAILLARAVVPQQYGAYVLGMNLAFFVELVQRSCLAIPYSVLSQNHSVADRSVYLGHTLVQHALLNLLAAGLLLTTGAALEWAGILDPTVVQGRFIPLFALLIVARNLGAICRSVALAHLQWIRLVTAGLVGNGLILLMLLCLTAAGRLDIHSVAYVLAGGTCLFSVLILKNEWQHLRFTTAGFGAAMTANWRHGRWILLSTLANSATLQALPWLALIWWDTRIVATIGALGTVACVIRPAIQATSSYLTPKLTRRLITAGAPATRRFTIRLTALLSLAAGVYIAVFVFFGDALIERLYAGRYTTGGAALSLVAAAVAVRAAHAPLRALLAAEQRPYRITSASGLASGVCLVTALLLIPVHGVVGMAAAMLAHSLTVLAATLWNVLPRNRAPRAHARNTANRAPRAHARNTERPQTP